VLVTIITIGNVKITYVFSTNKIPSMPKEFNFESKIKRTAAGSFMIGASSYLIVKALNYI